MTHRPRRYLATALLALLIRAILMPADAQTREITDMAGRQMHIPAVVNRIACMQGPSYEMVFMLGGRDRISLVRPHHKTAYPLALVTNPALPRIPALDHVGPKTPVNIEEFLRLRPDLVIYWNIPQELRKFEQAGIPALVVSWSSTVPATLEAANWDMKKKIHKIAQVMGPDAMARYTEWSDYFDQKVSFIRSRLDRTPPDHRPSVYIGNSWGANILATWGKFSANHFILELCGARFVGVNGPGKFPEVTREQFLGWAPDVIIVDNHGNKPGEVIQDLLTHPDWAGLPAVRDKRIHRIPSGVFFLDKGTTAPCSWSGWPAPSIRTFSAMWIWQRN